eukprot:1154707-Pelagomonas_calceolata.AAC.2
MGQGSGELCLSVDSNNAAQGDENSVSRIFAQSHLDVCVGGKPKVLRLSTVRFEGAMKQDSLNTSWEMSLTACASVPAQLHYL